MKKILAFLLMFLSTNLISMKNDLNPFDQDSFYLEGEEPDEEVAYIFRENLLSLENKEVFVKKKTRTREVRNEIKLKALEIYRKMDKTNKDVFSIIQEITNEINNKHFSKYTPNYLGIIASYVLSKEEYNEFKEYKKKRDRKNHYNKFEKKKKSEKIFNLKERGLLKIISNGKNDLVYLRSVSKEKILDAIEYARLNASMIGMNNIKSFFNYLATKICSESSRNGGSALKLNLILDAHIGDQLIFNPEYKAVKRDLKRSKNIEVGDSFLHIALKNALKTKKGALLKIESLIKHDVGLDIKNNKQKTFFQSVKSIKEESKKIKLLNFLEKINKRKRKTPSILKEIKAIARKIYKKKKQKYKNISDLIREITNKIDSIYSGKYSSTKLDTIAKCVLNKDLYRDWQNQQSEKSYYKKKERKPEIKKERSRAMVIFLPKERILKDEIWKKDNDLINLKKVKLEDLERVVKYALENFETIGIDNIKSFFNYLVARICSRNSNTGGSNEKLKIILRAKINGESIVDINYKARQRDTLRNRAINLGDTFLHIIAKNAVRSSSYSEKGAGSKVETLLWCGADPKVLDKEGKLPSEIAEGIERESTKTKILSLLKNIN